MDIRDLLPKDAEGRLRIIQETVPGRQITLAHVVTSPKPIVYRKLGLNPDIDFERSAIGIITLERIRSGHRAFFSSEST